MTVNIACLKSNHADTLTIDKYLNKHLHKNVVCLILYRCVIHEFLRHFSKEVDFIAFTHIMSAVMYYVKVLTFFDKYRSNLDFILRVTYVTSCELCPHEYLFKSLVYAALFLYFCHSLSSRS